MTIQTAQLEDLKMELWLRRRNSGAIVWFTKDKKDIPIKDMTDSHLMNTIRMLEKEQENWENYLEGLGGDWQG